MLKIQKLIHFLFKSFKEKIKKIETMGKRDVFKVGDFVFARIKGYRPWPAKVIQVCTKQRYHVYFYGSGEMGKNVKSEDLSFYQEKKEKLKPGSLKGEFKQAIDQIDAAVAGKDVCPDDGSMLSNVTDQDSFMEPESTSEAAIEPETPQKKTENNNQMDSGRKRKLDDATDESQSAKKTDLPVESPDVQSYIEIVDPETLDGLEEKKYKLLDIEWKVFKIMESIKGSLSLENADAKTCLELLEDLKIYVADMTTIMLMKNPSFVEMVKRLRRYVGNAARWQLSKKETEEFEEDAAKIRDTASDLYEDIKYNFQYDSQKPFWHSFSFIVAKFNTRVTKCETDFLTKLCFEYELP